MGIQFRTQGFSGLVPRMDARFLKPNEAQTATNAVLTSGAIKPRNEFLLAAVPVIVGEIKSIFRIERDEEETWLVWDKDVDVVRSLVAGDITRRFYYTGDFEPRQSNFDLATTGGPPYPFGKFVLGVAEPLNALVIDAVTGGSGLTSVRSYTYTFVTPLGEESKPAPPSDVSAAEFDDGTWELIGMDVAPLNTGAVAAAVKDTPVADQVTVTLGSGDLFGLRALEEIIFLSVGGMTDLDGSYSIISVDFDNDKVVVAQATTQTYTSGGSWARGAPHNVTGMNKRIYRTLTSPTGTEFHYVATVTAATTTYDDTTLDSDVGLAETLQSTDWEMPPAAAQGMITLANGISAIFFGNEVGISEPFRPYAWPIRFRQSTEHDVVGIGYFGTTITVMTKGLPYTISGVDPVTMGGGMEKMQSSWPCLSKRGIAPFAFGTAYPAPQGLVILGIQNDLVTRDLFTVKEWKELAPETFVSATSDNQYYFAYTILNSTIMGVIDKREFASLTQINTKVTELWTDELTDKLYAVFGNRIYEVEGQIGEKINYSWKSKRFTLPKPINLGAARVDAKFTQTLEETQALQAQIDAIVVLNQAIIDGGLTNDGMADTFLGEYEIGGDAMQELPSLQINSLQFQFYADGDLKLTKQLNDNRAFSLPDGYKADNCEFTLSGNVEVTGVVLAETHEGLGLA